MSGKNGAVCGTQVRGGSSGKPERESRRMALLKRTGLFSGKDAGTDIKRATSVEDLQEAYRLVHDVFVEQGYIHPVPSGLRIRPYEALPDTATFVAEAEGRIVGVQSLVVDSEDMGLPSDEAFRDVIDILRAEDRLVCEATNEAVDTAYRKTSVATELMRCCFAHALGAGYTDLIATVSPGHAKFYGLLGFEQIGEVRSYSEEIEDSVVVVRFDLSALSKVLEDIIEGQDEADLFLKRYFVDDNPYHRYVKTWRILSDRFFADTTLLTELFVHSSGLLGRCSEGELEAIRRQWGEKLFAEVMSHSPESAVSA